MKALIVAGFLVVCTAIGASAQMQNNPWCAYFTGGTVNCRFATFQQCLEAIHGKTGLCNENSQDVSAADATPKPVHRRRPQN